jgi:drug/metabolite transporter (DMT)-like permease
VIAIAELVVAVLSATLLGSESLSAREAMGGALIALAAVLEATDSSSVSVPTLNIKPQ